jgi:hypothetical protein
MELKKESALAPTLSSVGEDEELRECERVSERVSEDVPVTTRAASRLLSLLRTFSGSNDHDRVSERVSEGVSERGGASTLSPAIHSMPRTATRSFMVSVCVSE